MKIKILTVFLCTTLLLTMLSSCAAKDKFLKNCGEDVISMMAEMLESDEFAEVYEVPDQLMETISKLSDGDFQEIDEIYELIIPVDQFTETSFDEDDFSEDLYQYVCSSAYVSFANRINVQSGNESLAASSMYCAQKCFTNRKLEENTIYLYVFEDACPIAISFTMSGKDTIRATGYFIINDEFDTDDEDSIRKSCKNFGFSGVTVEKR